jgi:hypothetical protein
MQAIENAPKSTSIDHSFDTTFTPQAVEWPGGEGEVSSSAARRLLKIVAARPNNSSSGGGGPGA